MDHIQPTYPLASRLAVPGRVRLLGSYRDKYSSLQHNPNPRAQSKMPKIAQTLQGDFQPCSVEKNPIGKRKDRPKAAVLRDFLFLIPSSPQVDARTHLFPTLRKKSFARNGLPRFGFPRPIQVVAVIQIDRRGQGCRSILTPLQDLPAGPGMQLVKGNLWYWRW